VVMIVEQPAVKVGVPQCGLNRSNTHPADSNP
jgi:hypothetical protein